MLNSYTGTVSPMMIEAVTSHLRFTNYHRVTLGLPELTRETASAVLSDNAAVLAVSDWFEPRQLEVLRVRDHATYLVPLRDLEVSEGATLVDEIGSLIRPLSGKEHTEMFFPLPSSDERQGQHTMSGRARGA